jgi:predicted NAD/FAD-dependent oxidoreductase
MTRDVRRARAAGSAPVVILGSGMAALGAAERLRATGEPFLVFDASSYYGGHTASFRHPGGFVFDDGAPFRSRTTSGSGGF